MSWLRYQKIDEAKNELKWWAIGPVRQTVRDSGQFFFDTTWGRIGTKGQEKRYRYDNATSARAKREAKIAEKKLEGYVLVINDFITETRAELDAKAKTKRNDADAIEVLTDRKIELS